MFIKPLHHPYMKLRSGREIHHRRNPAMNMTLRSGRELYFPPRGASNETLNMNPMLDDEIATPVKLLVPDEVKSSIKYEEEEDLTPKTPPELLRLATRTPVDAMEWSQLGWNDQQELAREGRAPIKQEDGGKQGDCKKEEEDGDGGCSCWL